MSATEASFPEDSEDIRPDRLVVYPAETLKNAIFRAAVGYTLPFGFYYPTFESLVPVLKNGDVFGATDEALSWWASPIISAVLGLFLIVMFVWGVTSVISFVTTPFRWVLPIKRPAIRRLLAYIIATINNSITQYIGVAKPDPLLNFQVNAPGLNIARPVDGNPSGVGFGLILDPTTISYSISLQKDPVAVLQALLASFVDELSLPGSLGSKKSPNAFRKGTPAFSGVAAGGSSGDSKRDVTAVLASDQGRSTTNHSAAFQANGTFEAETADNFFLEEYLSDEKAAKIASMAHQVQMAIIREECDLSVRRTNGKRRVLGMNMRKLCHEAFEAVRKADNLLREHRQRRDYLNSWPTRGR